jgi:hypothetical protein
VENDPQRYFVIIVNRRIAKDPTLETTLMTQLGQGRRLRAIDVFDITILRLWQPLPAEP